MEGNYREHMPRPSFVYCTTSNERQNGQENLKSPSVDDSRPSSVHTLLKPIVVFSSRMKPNSYFISLVSHSFIHDRFEEVDHFIAYSEPWDA